MRTYLVITLSVLIAGWGCGEDVELSGNGSNTEPPEGCIEGGPECNNCLDDDGDTLIDGFDPHCISALDDREDSFATGIPGDNNNVDYQDCFFDGNSGHGDDGCRRPTCCLLDPDAPDCPPSAGDTCDISQECVDNCAPYAPPGCDCFGCCTICVGDRCRDILINSTLAPDCDLDGFDDAQRCPRCVKGGDCGAECDPQNCILCPGQGQDDLPDACDQQVCPGGLTVCSDNADCQAGQFCANGCCIDNIE